MNIVKIALTKKIVTNDRGDSLTVGMEAEVSPSENREKCFRELEAEINSVLGIDGTQDLYNGAEIKHQKIVDAHDAPEDLPGMEEDF